LYISFENSSTTPEYDPLNSDVPFEVALRKFRTSQEKEAYQNLVIDQSKRKNFSLNNVRKIRNPEKETNRIYDLENFSASYAYGTVIQSNIQTESYVFETYRGNLAYNFQPTPINVEPFKEINFLDNKYLQLIKDINFNFMPSMMSARIDLDRTYMKTQNRNDQLSTAGVDPLFQKSFFINRFYSLNWELTKNLSLDFSSSVNAVVDEPEGELDTEAKLDSLRSNIRRLGRTTSYNQQFVANYKIPLDKFPLTDWISADARYEASYSWFTGAIGQRDTLGNVIQNTRDRSISGKVDFIKLYNKSNKLRALNTPKRPTIPGRPNVQEEEDEEKASGEGFGNELLKFAMMIKEVNFRYQISQGTFLPGYMENSGLLGMDRSFMNPGFGFVFGSQNSNLRYDLANNGLIAPSDQLTQTFRQNELRNIQVTSIIEPIKDFRITLEVRKRETGEYSEIFRRESSSEDFTSINPNRLGAYSISYNILKTVFAKDDAQNNSPLFRNFEQYRQIIKSRLEVGNPGGEYALNGQSVLIPAFLAAYSGRSAEGVDLSPFPKMPLPNWRISYNGLSRIPVLQEHFSSINLTHNYSSSYDVSNFSNSLLYQNGLELYNTLQNIPQVSMTDEFGAYIPIFILNDVVIKEGFAPLIGIDLLTKDRMNVSFEYNTERTIGLNFSNAQVTEQKSFDFRFDLGYTKAGVRIPFKIQGRDEVLSNDLTFRVSTRIVDTQTIQRKIEEINTLTNGNLNISLRPTIGYVVNQKLNVSLYFDRIINDPKVSTAFRRSSTAFGGQLTFNLSE